MSHLLLVYGKDLTELCGATLGRDAFHLVVHRRPKPHQAENLNAHRCRTGETTTESPFPSLLQCLLTAPLSDLQEGF